jgi:hypothetical protein
MGEEEEGRKKRAIPLRLPPSSSLVATRDKNILPGRKTKNIAVENRPPLLRISYII